MARLPPVLVAICIALAGLSLSGAREALATPPPPPPPDVLATIQADCRKAPAERVDLALTQVAIPSAPTALNVQSAFRLDAPPSAHLGQVIGITRTWSGSIIMATDRGLWIRVPRGQDESWTPLQGPVAMSMRGIPGEPTSMAFWGWSGEPGIAGANVSVLVPGQPHLFRYEISDCFPGAEPKIDRAIPAGDTALRLQPDVENAQTLLVQNAAGQQLGLPEWVRGEAKAESALVTPSDLSAEWPLAQGCDTVTFTRAGNNTLVQTGCSPGFEASMAAVWGGPQHQHRQPAAILGVQTLGRISLPIVAVSEADYDHSVSRPDPVLRGDPNNHGSTCTMLMASQPRIDGPITVIKAQPLCAYYPRDPSGAPYPPPPPAP